jgi:hypothetical protein
MEGTIAMTGRWTGSDGGVEWTLDLDDPILLPGRLARGTVTLVAADDVEGRAVVATLRGEESWRHVVSTGKTTTVVTSTEDAPPVAVVVSGPLRLVRGDTRTLGLDIPVPPLGPATLDGGEAAMRWTLEVKLDVARGMDSSIEVPVAIAQPVALLRAGVIRVGEFALYEAADAQGGGVEASVELHPMPLVIGEPLRGRLVLDPVDEVSVTEIRVEVRVKVESTVSGARMETHTLFSSVVAGAGVLAERLELPFEGTLEPRRLPTITLPHGRSTATVHVILARRLAFDPHLVREITIATTSAL